MSEQNLEQPLLPLAGIGPRLKAAREAKGLPRSAIAQQTRIGERVIADMEEGNWDKLPSRTYALGFSRSYARIVGLDENEVAGAVREELGMSSPQTPSRQAAALEPGDPARVPSARFAWWLGLAALVVIAAGLFFWRTYYVPAMSLPPLVPEESAAPGEGVVTTDVSAPAFLPTTDPQATFSPSTAPLIPVIRPSARNSPAPREGTGPAPRASGSPGGAPAASTTVSPAAVPSTVSN